MLNRIEGFLFQNLCKEGNFLICIPEQFRVSSLICGCQNVLLVLCKAPFLCWGFCALCGSCVMLNAEAPISLGTEAQKPGKQILGMLTSRWRPVQVLHEEVPHHGSPLAPPLINRFKFKNRRNVSHSFIKQCRVNSHSRGWELRVKGGIHREKPTPNQKRSPGNHKETTLKTKCSSGILHQSVVGVTCSTWENSLFSGAS